MNTADEVEPVDLDEVLSRFHRPAAGVVEDPQDIAAIRARRLYAQLLGWRRWSTPTPPGWNDIATGPIN